MAQTLTTTILINAKTGNGFSKVGATLTELGSLVNGISEQLIEFGTDSVNVYREYEKSMKDAEVALSTTYGRSTRELSGVMSQLDAAATEWAATTIFHTDDVANAIAEAAHAGWDLDQIMTGIPAAMELAQAGSIDLSEAVNYIVKSTNAAGIEFEDIGTFIDHWAFAANSSATNIDELGAAMLRMGGTMKFAKNTDELLTMLAILADTGYTGSEAGTLLRNSMIRLVAPTKNAREAMAQLGATSDETAELLEDSELAAANARLAAQGFSLYDEDGNMKSMLDTYRDLYVALGEVAGGYEDMERNADVEAILGAIFPQRSITGALALLEAASTGYNGLYEALQNGDASDYGEYAATTMMDSLNGKIETFESKMERLKQAVGEELAPQLETALESIGGLVDKVATMDDAKFSALVGGLEIIAAAGPTLLAAGAAMRIIGLALNPYTAAGAGIVGVVALINALEKLKDANFEENFGNLSLNSEQVSSFLSTLATDFETANAPITAYHEALAKAVENYQTASETLKSDLLTDMLTGAELTEEQKGSLEKIGEAMCTSVEDGIKANYGAVAEGIAAAFEGGEEEGDLDNPIWAQMSAILEQGFEADLEKAESLSKQLRDAMTSAFKNGLTSDEIANIQKIIDEQNELIARQQEIDNYVKRQEILRKGQSLGLEGILESVGAAKEQADDEWEQKLQQQDRDYKTMESQYDWAIKNGIMVPNTDGTEGEHRATKMDKMVALSTLQEKQETERYRWTAEESGFIMQTMLEGIRSSDLSDTWAAIEQMASGYREAGGIITRENANRYNEAVNADDAEEASRYLNLMMEQLGGYERVQGFADFFASQGNETFASMYQSLLDMYDVAGNGNKSYAESGTQGTGTYETTGTYEQLATLLKENGTTLTPEGLIENMNLSRNEWGQEPDWYGTLGEDLYNQVLGAASSAGFGSITDWVSSIETSIIPDMEDVTVEDQTMNIIPEVDESDIPSIDPIPVPIEPITEGIDAVDQLEAQGVQVDVEGDTQSLEATIDGEDGKTLLEYVDGDASDLSMKISDQDGKTLVENVTGNTSSLAAAIAAYEGRTITVNIVGNRLFASGGRATTASIFGEAGPEWAIPEEHSERTAQLLDAAREASGFTWPDLLSRVGGMNANPGHTPSTIIYSPTINAADASGVEAVLAEDKKRFEKWWEEKQIRDEVEVYQ